MMAQRLPHAVSQPCEPEQTVDNDRLELAAPHRPRLVPAKLQPSAIRIGSRLQQLPGVCF